MQASVKVMRSHDYCHFEVALSAECEDIDAVDALRKQAAVLVDEAVRQYRIAKQKESRRGFTESRLEELVDRVEAIKKRPRSEWTPEDAAIMRGIEDHRFFKEFDEEAYYYSDPEREHHFSMLRRFKDVTVRAGDVAVAHGNGRAERRVAKAARD